jgi:Domain of unknown function (DUF1823)
MADIPGPAPTTETCWAILKDEMPDEAVNRLLWHCLGYRCLENGKWDTTEVNAEWVEQYPEPPDFIGSRPATVKLTRSIPAEHKQLLKEQLGFKGYTVNELNPNRTRRATAVSWLLSYMQQPEPKA